MMPATPALDLTQAAMRERVESARMRSKPVSTIPFGFETGAVVQPTPALSPQVTLESALQVAQKLSLHVMGAEAEMAFAGALMGFSAASSLATDSSGRVAPTPTLVLSPRISTVARRADSSRSKRRPALAKRRARAMPRQTAAISSKNAGERNRHQQQRAFSTLLNLGGDIVGAVRTARHTRPETPPSSQRLPAILRADRSACSEHPHD